MRIFKIIAHSAIALAAGALVIYLVLLNFGWFRGKVFVPERSEPVSSAGAPKIRAELVTCSGIKESRPGKLGRRFGFGEKINAYAYFRDVAPGPHRASFHWFTPEGKCQETFSRNFQSDDGSYACWSWIELEGELFPVSLGPLGSGKFIGDWTVKLYCDGFFLTETNFTVR